MKKLSQWNWGSRKLESNLMVGLGFFGRVFRRISIPFPFSRIRLVRRRPLNSVLIWVTFGSFICHIFQFLNIASIFVTWLFSVLFRTLRFVFWFFARFFDSLGRFTTITWSWPVFPKWQCWKFQNLEKTMKTIYDIIHHIKSPKISKITSTYLASILSSEWLESFESDRVLDLEWLRDLDID